MPSCRSTAPPRRCSATPPRSPSVGPGSAACTPARPRTPTGVGYRRVRVLAGRLLRLAAYAPQPVRPDRPPPFAPTGDDHVFRTDRLFAALRRLTRFGNGAADDVDQFRTTAEDLLAIDGPAASRPWNTRTPTRMSRRAGAARTRRPDGPRAGGFGGRGGGKSARGKGQFPAFLLARDNSRGENDPFGTTGVATRLARPGAGGFRLPAAPGRALPARSLPLGPVCRTPPPVRLPLHHPRRRRHRPRRGVRHLQGRPR